MAEAFERARYEHLRGQRWADLRLGERTTRTEVAGRAFDEAGITAYVATLRARFSHADELEGILGQRDAEIARRRAEHDQEVSVLEQQLAAVRAEVATIVSRAEAAEQQAAEQAATIAAVRSSLGLAPAAEATPFRDAEAVPQGAGPLKSAATSVAATNGPAPKGADGVANRPAARNGTSLGRFNTSRLGRAATGRV